MVYTANWGIICHRSHLLREPEKSIDIQSEDLHFPLVDGTPFVQEDPIAELELLPKAKNDWIEGNTQA